MLSARGMSAKQLNNHKCPLQTASKISKELNWKQGSQVAPLVKNLPAMQETPVWSLGWEDPLEEGVATHSSFLPEKSPWTEEPGGYSPCGCKVPDTPEQLNTTHRTNWCNWVYQLLHEIAHSPVICKWMRMFLVKLSLSFFTLVSLKTDVQNIFFFFSFFFIRKEKTPQNSRRFLFKIFPYWIYLS